MVTGIDKVRPCLERLHLAAPLSQRRQDRQCHRRLADTAVGTGNN
jgi:hypothetical protein